MSNTDISKICHVADDENTLSAYSVDASIFKVRPSKVAFPKDAEELKKLVTIAGTEQQITLSPRAAGTCMSGGSLTEGVMVDMKDGFNKICEVDLKNKQVWVEAGTYYRELEKVTLKHDLIFAPYTSSKDLCCIGGMIGNNASGEKSLRYGATVDNVVAIKMICSDGNEYLFGKITEKELGEKKLLQNFEGEIYRKISSLIFDNLELIKESKPKVRKNAAGYDLWNVWNEQDKTFDLSKLLVGSQGTLGFITEALIKLVDAPKYTKMIVLPVPTLNHLAEAVEKILEHKPEGLETYDSHTYELAKLHMKVDAKYGARADGANLVLFAQFAEESQEETDKKAVSCVNDLKNMDFEAVVIENEVEREAHWAIRRASYKLLKDHAPKGFFAAPMIEDTIVPIHRYGEFLRDLEKILEDYKIIYTFAGHIGDGSIRLIPLVDSNVPEYVNNIFDLSRRVYELTVRYGGSISVDHNDGIIRTPFLNLMFKPEMLDLFTKTKEIFDSKSIFNPGKKTGGSIEFAKTHVIKK